MNTSRQHVYFVNSRQQKLSAYYYSASIKPSNAMIIMAHGFTSDKISRGRFAHYAKAFNAMGYDAMAFDFSGCGESDAETINMDKQVDDLNCAIAFVQSKGYQKIALLGHSLGSYICLRVFSDAISTIILTGALTGPMHYDWDEYLTEEQKKELQEKGHITKHTPDNIRKKVLVDGQMLKDIENINQAAILKPITCPVLIIHGDADEEEKLLLENSRKTMKFLPSTARLEVIPGAEHNFLKHIGIVTSFITKWLGKYFSI